ncbi:MAG: nucleotidyltransferase family protein [Bryobacteraceae bacterium]
MITIAAYDLHVEQLFEKMRRLHLALDEAGIPYRVVGGVAVFLQIFQRDPGKARMTQDIDVAIDRDDLAKIANAATKHGFTYRHTAGIDMLVDAANPHASSAVHFIFVREKVRPDYLEPVPDFSEATVSSEGVLLAPVADLVR